MEKKFNFIKSKLNDLPIPSKEEGRIYYYDTQLRSLAICVTPSGSKTFYVVRRVEGKPERIRIGPYPDLSIEQARNLAHDANGKIARGENPNRARRDNREEMTFGELFQLYLNTHLKEHRKSWKNCESQYRLYFSKWSERKLSSINRQDVRELHLQIKRDVERRSTEQAAARAEKKRKQTEKAGLAVMKGSASGEGSTQVPIKSGGYAANRALVTLRALFSWANTHEYFSGDNPATGVTQFPEKSRDRRLHQHELPAFFQAVAEEPNQTIRDYVLMSLMTGARRANVLAMRWDQVSFERKIWTIPETKNGTSQEVPLTETAVEILRQRRAEVDGPFVFPGPGAKGHLAEPKKGWTRILERSGLADLRLHDLRRTLGSWQVDTGATLAVVGRTLNHKSQSTTAIYARLSVDPVREAMERATVAMLKAGKLKAAGPEGDQ